MSILIIDDEPEISRLISEVLTEEGYMVDQTANGYAALAYLRAVPTLPCVILLDLMMPLMSGWDFLRVQQSDAMLASIPTVVISAAHTFEAAKVLGAQDCLVKPLDLDYIVNIVQRYCVRAPTS
jgi:CheY-like chemotaxis protein